MAWRVYRKIETAASISKRFNFNRNALNASVKRLRDKSYVLGKRGRSYVIDEFTAVEAKEAYASDEPSSEAALKEALQNAYELKLLNQAPEKFAKCVADGGVPLIAESSLRRYVKRRKADEYPFNL
jgi:DNA-binding GntR family transcriptional regulator